MKEAGEGVLGEPHQGDTCSLDQCPTPPTVEEFPESQVEDELKLESLLPVQVQVLLSMVLV